MLYFSPEDLETKNNEEYRVYLEPPVDQNGDTDCDDDDEEEEENVQPVNIDVLPHRVLLAPAEVGSRATRNPQIIGIRGMDEDFEDEISPANSDIVETGGDIEDSAGIHRPPKRRRGPKEAAISCSQEQKSSHAPGAQRKKTARLVSQLESEYWSQEDVGNVGSKILEFKINKNSSIWQHLKNITIDSPLHFYKEFMPDEFLQLVIDQSKVYSEQQKNKSWAKWQNEVSMDSLRIIEGIMLLSGYNQLPSRRLYWEQREDVYNKMVAENIRLL